MVPKNEAEEWAEEENIKYFEVSAKEGTNVDMVFHHLAKEVSNKKKEKKEKDEKLIQLDQIKRNNKKEKEKKSKCC